MKVCLIFSPFSSLSYIPLGISYLKSFIEKNIPDIHVKNLDLSNDFYHNLDKEAFLNLLLHLCQICPDNKNPKCKGMFRNTGFNFWIKVARVFKSYITDSKTDEFYNSEKYNELRRLYDLFCGQIYYCINRVQRWALEAPGEENDGILENSLFREDIDKIISEGPEIVGFSVFSESQLYYSLALSKVLKARINPQIIFGGAYISHLDKKTILQIFHFVDFIIYKEGELGIVSLLKNLVKRRFDGVPNLVYRKEAEIIENKEAIVYNLDQIPFPDFSDYDLKNYFTPQPVLSMLFSRGCNWGACTFCAHHKTYSKPYRTRSISNFILEIKRYEKIGIKHICFADEIVSAQDIDLINKALLKEKINIYYQVMLKPTGDFTPEILERIYKAGGRLIVWGVESFNQRILNLMNKGTRAKEIKNILKISHKMGLFNHVCLIQKFPTQTEREVLEDMEILRKNSKYLYSFDMHNFWLEEDTAIFRNTKKFGLEFLKKKCLLKIKRSKLFSPEIAFTSKGRIDQRRLDNLAEENQIKDNYLNKFRDAGIFFSMEHMLLHLTHYAAQLCIRQSD